MGAFGDSYTQTPNPFNRLVLRKLSPGVLLFNTHFGKLYGIFGFQSVRLSHKEHIWN
jgi:hypothetical protein